MRIVEAIERKEVAIPIRDLQKADGSFDFLSQIKDKGYFDIDYRKDEIVLLAGKFIGQIPLTQDIAIHVHPKVPISNLARMIGIANHPIRCLDFYRRRYELESHASASLLEAMARSMLRSLRELSVEGIYKEYRSVSKNLSSIKGRIDIPAFIRTSLPRAQISSIRCTYHEFSIDTLYNRLIKRAIDTVGVLLAEQGMADKSLIREFAYFADYFDRVSLDPSPTLVERVKSELLHKHVPDLRRYYLDILDVCCIVLEGEGLQLQNYNGGSTLHSLIVNLEDAFEQYTRHSLKQELSARNLNLPVLDGNKEGKSKLFYDNNAISAKPDLIIGEKDSAFVLGDVKYKSEVVEKDRYQLISHALSYGVKVAFIISPAQDSANSGPLLIGSIGRESPIKIYHYRFDLEAANIQEQESCFSEWVLSLISADDLQRFQTS